MFNNKKSQINSARDLMTDVDVIVVGTLKFGAIFKDVLLCWIEDVWICNW